jgi:hypothetical protein
MDPPYGIEYLLVSVFSRQQIRQDTRRAARPPVKARPAATALPARLGTVGVTPARARGEPLRDGGGDRRRLATTASTISQPGRLSTATASKALTLQSITPSLSHPAVIEASTPGVKGRLG